MSTEIHLNGLTLPIPDEMEDLAGLPDRVVMTAEDRPHTDTLPALPDPAVAHDDEQLAARRGDVDEKHRRVAAFLEANCYDSIVLSRADSVAWFTAGGDLRQTIGGDSSSVALFINRQSRAVVTDNVQSARVFEEELGGLGFQLKERPWHDDPGRIVAELTRNRRVASDGLLPNLADVSDRLILLREFTRFERQRLRELGRTLAVAVEATCRNFQPGETEADIAGHLAHRLLREGVVPVELRIAGDDRLERYRQPMFKKAPIRRRAIVMATGRRHGLCASVTRIVSFGLVEPSFRAAHGLAAMIDATCIFFSRPDESVAGVFRRARRIYEKFCHTDEWMLDYAGGQIGYAPRELEFLPDSPAILTANTGLRWSSSVGSARSEDTIVIDKRGYEVITEAQIWPKLEVTVKGFPIQRPGILER